MRSLGESRLSPLRQGIDVRTKEPEPVQPLLLLLSQPDLAFEGGQDKLADGDPCPDPRCEERFPTCSLGANFRHLRRQGIE